MRSEDKNPLPDRPVVVRDRSGIVAGMRAYYENDSTRALDVEY